MRVLLIALVLLGCARSHELGGGDATHGDAGVLRDSSLTPADGDAAGARDASGTRDADVTVPCVEESHFIDVPHDGPTSPLLAYDGTGFGLLWGRGHRSGCGLRSWHFRRLDENGRPVSPAREVVRTGFNAPATLSLVADEFWVTWLDLLEDGGGVRLARLDETGEPVADTEVLVRRVGTHHAIEDRDGLALIWAEAEEDGRAGFVRLSSTVDETARHSLTDPATLNWPRLVRLPEGYAVLSENGFEGSFHRRLDTTGAPVGTPLEVVEDRRPGPAHPSGPSAVYALGTGSGSATISPAGDEVILTVLDAMGRRVRQEHVAIVRGPVSGIGAAAGASGDVGVVWHSTTGVHFLRLDGSGTVVEGPRLLLDGSFGCHTHGASLSVVAVPGGFAFIAVMDLGAGRADALRFGRVCSRR